MATRPQPTDVHLQDNGLKCDIVPKGALSEILLRLAELLLTEELPPLSHRRQVLTLPAEAKSREAVKKHLGQAVAEVGFVPEEEYRLTICTDEVITHAIKGDSPDFKVILEVGQEDLIVTVVNRGQVEAVASRDLQFTRKLLDDFLLLFSSEKVIASIPRSGQAIGGPGVKSTRATCTIDQETAVAFFQKEADTPALEELKTALLASRADLERRSTLPSRRRNPNPELSRRR